MGDRRARGDKFKEKFLEEVKKAVAGAAFR